MIIFHHSTILFFKFKILLIFLTHLFQGSLFAIQATQIENPFLIISLF